MWLNRKVADMNPLRIFQVVLVLVALFIALTVLPPAWAQPNRDIEAEFYAFFRSAMAADLRLLIQSRSEASVGDVISSGLTALDRKADVLRSEKWVKDRYEVELTGVKRRMQKLVKNANMPLAKGDFSFDQDAVDRYLVALLDDSAGGTNPLSDYRFLVGGSWAHSDEGATQGIVTAALLVRSRLLDFRADKWGATKIGESEKEEKEFLDLVVDSRFITEQPVAGNNTFTDSTFNADSTFVKAVSSSQISTGLFYALPYRFADWAATGPVVRFNVFSQKGKIDVFRRLTLGWRIENRSELTLRGAAIELGFAPNKTAGFEEGDLSLGFDRVILDMELPLNKSTSRRGMYVQFHTEYPIGSKRMLNGIKVKAQDVAPPVYQFRVGATFDPVEIIGPWFGI